MIMPLETLLQILIYAKPGVIGPPLLTSMQGGYEDDFVVILQDVFTFPLQLPISVIYQDEDTRSHCATFEKELPPLLEQVIFQPTHQVLEIGTFVIDRSRRDLDRVRFFIREEELEPPSELDSD